MSCKKMEICLVIGLRICNSKCSEDLNWSNLLVITCIFVIPKNEESHQGFSQYINCHLYYLQPSFFTFGSIKNIDFKNRSEFFGYIKSVCFILSFLESNMLIAFVKEIQYNYIILQCSFCSYNSNRLVFFSFKNSAGVK